MMVIFLSILGLAVGSTVFILLNEDFGKIAKAFAVALTGGSILFLFMPSIHFLVPLVMQLVVCIWVALYRQFQR
jgi:hypothetical protein